MKRLLLIAVAVITVLSCIFGVSAETDMAQSITVNSVIISVEQESKTIEVSVQSDDSGLTALFNDTAVTEYNQKDNEFIFTYTASVSQELSIKIVGDNSVSDTVVCNLSRYTQTGKKYAQYINTALGDANADGVTNIKDLVNVKKIIAEVIASSSLADFGKDGYVTTLDLTALAKLLISKNAGVVLHTVTYAEESGAVMQTVLVPDGFGTKPTVNTKKDGYTFIGWSAQAKNVTEDIVIYANYTMDDIYTEWPEGFV